MFLVKVVVIFLLTLNIVHAGVIKDLFQKLTNSNNQTEDVVKQSAPICGSGIFSTPNEKTLSPEVIFITNKASRIVSTRRPTTSSNNNYSRDEQEQRRGDNIKEVANEFRFHVENVTLEELERNGFNRNAPVTFLMHGFTSGYPLQAWISAIVEAYTIDRQTNLNNLQDHTSSFSDSYDYSSSQRNHHSSSSSSSSSSRLRQRERFNGNEGGGGKLKHNLLIVNWHYAARGIVYPRAVANIPIVASYVTRFINEKLIDEAGIDPRRIQLIGHSLGAHLAGFIGKNTRSKVGRIYGLDPAGPCFGSISGPLYPASKRLAPGDAEEVITIHTNTALLGIDKPLGQYSIFVEGGSVQPGCKGGGVLKSLQTLTFDGGDFDTVACSHSRAPNILTYRHDQIDSEDDCQLVAYECKDWDSFLQGNCGLCGPKTDYSSYDDSIKSVECIRAGLDWQYPTSNSLNYNNYDSDNRNNRRPATSRRPSQGSGWGSSNSSTRRPQESIDFIDDNSSNYDNSEYNNSNRRTSTRRPTYSSSSLSRDKRNDENKNKTTTSNTTMVPSDELEESRGLFSSSDSEDDGRKAKKMFIKTTDTAPYCAFHYQVILELNEQFPKNKKPPISLILQDSENRSSSGRRSSKGVEQNSLTEDNFGNKLTDKLYTHLLISSKKLKQVDHATMLFRDGLQDGYKIIKSLRINYMSHIDPKVRQRFSSRLCLVRKQQQGDGSGSGGDTLNRFFFEPCDRSFSSSSSSSSFDNNSNNRNPYESNNNNNREDNSGWNNYERETTSRRPKHNHGNSSYSHHN